MLKIETKLIEGATANQETEIELRKTMGIEPEVAINPMVFEVNYNNKKYYCCWSGGSLVNDKPAFTLLGQAALEGLINLPLGNNDVIKLQELKMGPTPLRSKIKKVLKKHRANTKICFFGDMSGELDGHMTPAFNLVDGKISL